VQSWSEGVDSDSDSLKEYGIFDDVPLTPVTPASRLQARAHAQESEEDEFVAIDTSSDDLTERPLPSYTQPSHREPSMMVLSHHSLVEISDVSSSSSSSVSSSAAESVSDLSYSDDEGIRELRLPGDAHTDAKSLRQRRDTTLLLKMALSPAPDAMVHTRRSTKTPNLMDVAADLDRELQEERRKSRAVGDEKRSRKPRSRPSKQPASNRKKRNTEFFTKSLLAEFDDDQEALKRIHDDYESSAAELSFSSSSNA
jgi:hypothetical protein